MRSNTLMNCTPYQAPIALTLSEAHLLNQIVGRYSLAADIAQLTQVRAIAISWSPNLTLTGPVMAMRIAGHECLVSWPNASSLPQVQAVLQNIPWSALDSDLQLATLEVALEELLGALDCSALALSELPISGSEVKQYWTFQVRIEWESGVSSELLLAFPAESLAWLASRLSQCARQASLDLGWLCVEADVVCGTTELSLAEIELLAVDDQVLFTARDPHLVFRHMSLTVPGQLREGSIHPIASSERSSPQSSSKLAESTLLTSPPSVTEASTFGSPLPCSRSNIPLMIVAGVVRCTLAEALHFAEPLSINVADASPCRLQHSSHVIAHGQCDRTLNRPAFTVTDTQLNAR